jgi:predicted Zn-dependent peptidase
MKVIADPIIEERIHIHEHPSGLRGIFVPKPGFSQNMVFFATDFGGIDTDFVPPDEVDPVHVPPGIAHFLEHVLFETETGNVSEQFSRQGAHSNAFTSHTMTAYTFSTTGDFETNFRTLLRFVQEPYFPDRVVEKERGIIEQEIKLYRDHPPSAAHDALLDSLYQELQVRIPIIGNLESIRQITPELLHRCHQTFYHPANMAVIVVGDQDPATLARIIDEEIRIQEPRPPIQRLHPEEPPAVKRREIALRMPVARPILVLGFKQPPRGTRGLPLLRQRIAGGLALELVFGRTSEFFHRNLRRNLIDEGFQYGFSAFPLFAHALIAGDTPDPDALRQEILGTIARTIDAGIPTAELERIRRAAYGGGVSRMNRVQDFAMWLLPSAFENHTFFDYLRNLLEITYDEVQQALELLVREENGSMVVVSPV